MVLDQLLTHLDTDANPDQGVVEAIKSALYDVAHAPRAIERAAGVMLWHRAWQASAPQPKRGGDKRSPEAKALAMQGKYQTLQLAGFDRSSKWSAFDLAAAEALGCDPSTIFRDRDLAEKLGPDAIRQLWRSPIADNAAALRHVSKLNRENQLSLFSFWEDDPELGFSDAISRLKVRAAARRSFAQQFYADFARQGSSDRREALLAVEVPEDVVEAVVRSWQKRGAR